MDRAPGSLRKGKGLPSGHFMVTLVCGSFNGHLEAFATQTVLELRRDCVRVTGGQGGDMEGTSLSFMGRLMGDPHELQCYGVTQGSRVVLNTAQEDHDFARKASVAVLAIRKRHVWTLLHSAPREIVAIIAKAILASRHHRQWALLRLQRPHCAVENNNLPLLIGTIQQSNHLMNPQNVKKLIRRASQCTCGNNQPVLSWLSSHLRDLGGDSGNVL